MENKNEFHIRPAVPQDATGLARFFQKNIEAHRALDPYFVLSSHFNLITFLEQAIKTPTVLLLVAEQTPEIVGYIYLRISSEHRAGSPKSLWQRLRRRKPFGTASMFAPYRLGFISDCFVEPAYRKQRIGSLLLAKGLDWLAEQNIAHIELEAYVGNAGAIKFWERHGFEIIKLKMRREIKRVTTDESKSQND